MHIEPTIWQTGLIIGKFYPVHRGHMHLIDMARQQVDTLHIIIGSKPDEVIPGRLRYQWLKELYPDPTVIIHYVADVNDAAGHPEPWRVWAADSRETLGFVPDVVFASDSYVEPFAAALGSDYCLIDIARKLFSISATQIRQSPFKHWNYCPAPVRGYYARRVAIVGGESCGKTTLAARLAHHYTTVWMPEYGREFVDRKQGIPTPEESRILTMETLRRQNVLACESNRVLVCDTELVVLKMLADLHFGYSPQHILDGIEQQRFDIYLLADDDIPWVGDGIHREGADIRAAQNKQIKHELDMRGIPYTLISGSIDQRMQQAAHVIDQCIE